MKNSFLAQSAPWLLRFHGVALVILALGNSVVSYRATLVATEGPFQFLFTNPAAEIGLLQAYLLMALLGCVLVVGSLQPKVWKFDLLGIAAHLVPLTALFAFRPLVVSVMGPNTFVYSLSIHGFFIAVEAVALLLGSLQTAQGNRG